MQGDWGTQFGMLIQHMDDSREGGLAGGAAEEDVKDLQAPCTKPGGCVPLPVLYGGRAPSSTLALVTDMS